MIPAKYISRRLSHLVLYSALFVFSGCASSTNTTPLKFISNWDELTNPVLEVSDGRITHVDAVYDRGTWFMFYSVMYEDSSGNHTRILEVSTRDFKTFSEPILSFNGEEDGWMGMTNPSVFKLRNIYYLAFNSWGDTPGKPSQLFYMTSRDLKKWTIKTPLAAEITSQTKATHPSLAFSRGRWFLLYNHNEQPRMAMTKGIRMPFERLKIDTLSFHSSTDTIVSQPHHQIINFGNKWGILTSGNNFNPYLYKLPTSGTSGQAWLTWDGGYPLKVIRREIALSPPPVSASMINMKKFGGYFYLFYVINPVGETTQETASSKIEVYRSTDLLYWAPAGR